ncbi:hypothetical protein NDU88_005771 [Pleurodeles waltl]|uniref:Secreted protein n=1 Tax=Pleurodeles waltl TaxID=8319 RepID=A0AAV7NT73_PLEWA|nr:hypothetical protein NDU88_005771 [Pleurodeles waltl]
MSSPVLSAVASCCFVLRGAYLVGPQWICGRAAAGLCVSQHTLGSIGERCSMEQERCRMLGCRHYLEKVGPPSSANVVSLQVC